MPQIPGSAQTIPQRLIELFKENTGFAIFKGFYEGDPIIPSLSQMPCMMISEPETDYDTGPTGHDEITHTILIQVVFNKKDEFGKPDNEATLENKIDLIVQGRDASTGDYIDTSVMGVLRRNFTLDGLAVESIGKVRKGVIPRAEDLITVEGHIDLTITELQSVASRV